MDTGNSSVDFGVGRERLQSQNQYNYVGENFPGVAPQDDLIYNLAEKAAQARAQQNLLFGGPGYGGSFVPRSVSPRTPDYQHGLYTEGGSPAPMPPTGPTSMDVGGSPSTGGPSSGGGGAPGAYPGQVGPGPYGRATIPPPPAYANPGGGPGSPRQIAPQPDLTEPLPVKNPRYAGASASAGTGGFDFGKAARQAYYNAYKNDPAMLGSFTPIAPQAIAGLDKDPAKAVQKYMEIVEEARKRGFNPYDIMKMSHTTGEGWAGNYETGGAKGVIDQLTQSGGIQASGTYGPGGFQERAMAVQTEGMTPQQLAVLEQSKKGMWGPYGYKGDPALAGVTPPKFTDPKAFSEWFFSRPGEPSGSKSGFKMPSKAELDWANKHGTMEGYPGKKSAGESASSTPQRRA